MPQYIKNRKTGEIRYPVWNQEGNVSGWSKTPSSPGQPGVEEENRQSPLELEDPTLSPLSWGERFKLSLIDRNPEHQMGVLAEWVGPENVTKTGTGDIAFRRSSDENFRLIDEPGWTTGDWADLVGPAIVPIAGTIGGIASLPIAGPAGYIAGGGVGGMIGEGVRKLAGEAFGVGEDISPMEHVTDVLSAGAGEATAEAVGGVVGKGIRLASGAFSRRIPEASRATLKRMDNLGVPGLHPTPAQIVGGPLIQFIEDFTEYSVTGSKLRTFKQVGREASDEVARKIAGRFTSSIRSGEDSVVALRNLIKDDILVDQAVGSDLRETVINEAVARIPSRAAGGMVDAPKILTKAELNPIEGLVNTGKKNAYKDMIEGSVAVDPTTKKIMPSENMIKLREDGGMTLGSALKLKTELQSRVQKMRKLSKTGERSVNQTMINNWNDAELRLDNLIASKIPEEKLIYNAGMKSAETVPLRALYREGNRIWKGKLLKETLVKDLVDKVGESSEGIKMLNKLTTEELSDFRTFFRGGINDPSFRTLSAMVLHNSLDNALSMSGKSVDQNILRNLLFGKGETIGFMNPKKLETMIGKSGVKEFEDIIDIMDLLKREVEAGPGKIQTAMLQFGAMGGILASIGAVFAGIVPPATPFALIAAPWIMARSVTNPRMRKLLYHGLTALHEKKISKATAIFQRLGTLDQFYTDQYRDMLSQPGDKMDQPEVATMARPMVSGLMRQGM